MSISNELSLSITKTSAITIEEFEKKKCSFLEYGEQSVYQNKYSCLTCDPDKKYPVCKDCFEICHINCKKTKINDSTEDSFICNCGKQKHQNINTLKGKPINCDIFEFDKTIKNMTAYKCITCSKENICSICFYECHNYCNVQRIDNVDEKDYSCDCNNENHALNTFIFDLSEYKKHFDELKIKFHIQIINCIYNTSAMNDFTLFVNTSLDQIKNDKIKPTQKQRLYSSFNVIINFFINFNYRSVYNFHDNFISPFSYELISSIINNFNSNDSDRDNDFAHYYVFFLFYFHLKRDYQNIKKFSIYDYLNSNIIERLQLRSLLYSNLTEDIQIKYKIYSKYNDSSESLSNIILKISELLSVKKLSEDYNIKVMILRVIYFCLKKLIFGYNDLLQLVKILNKSYHTIFYKYKEDLEIYCKDPSNEKYLVVPSVLTYLNKALYLISITYNDLVVNDALENKGEKLFIHHHSELGVMILEMLFKNCEYYSLNFEDKNGFISSKVLTIFNETIKMFILTDNNYHSDIIAAKKFGLTEYYNFQAVLDEIGKKDKLKISPDNSFRNSLISLINNLRENIQNELENYLYFKTSDIVERTISYFNQFTTKYSSLLKELPSFTDDNSEITENIKKYHTKITNYTNDLLPFSTNVVFRQKISIFIDVLRFSNIDEMMTKLIHKISDSKNEDSGKVVDLTIAFLSLLCLSETGLKYLIKGKNLSRINKIFHGRENRILEFLYIVFKGVCLYQIDIHFNKIIPLASKNMFLYMQGLNLNDNNDKIQIIVIIRIFTLIDKYYDFEEYKKVKGEILLYLLNKGILKTENFKNSFPDFKEDDDYSTNMIKNKIMNDTIRLNSKDNNDVNVVKVRRTNSGELSLLNNEENKESANIYDMKLSLNRRVSVASSGMRLSENMVVDIDKIRDNIEKNNISKKNQEFVDQSLYFAFFKLVSHHTYYTYHNEKFRDIIDNLYSFNELEYFKILLSKNYISLRQRIILLKYILTFYLLDILKQNELKNELLYMKGEEYQTYLKMKKNNENISIDMQIKERFMKNLEILTQIFIQEFDNMIIWSYPNNNKNDIYKYLEFLLLSIKFISDYFFIERSLSNHIIINFYKLSYKFISKSQAMKKLLKCLKEENTNSLRSEIISIFQDEKTSKENVKKLIDINFNFFDVDNIYKNVIEAYAEINSEVKIDVKFRLKKYLYFYDKKVSLNFFTIGLLFDGEYEAFYEDLLDEKNKKIREDKSNNIFRNLLIKYNKQFYNIKDTNFLNIIGTVSGEDIINYRQLLCNYFISYIRSNKHVDENFDMSIISIITKLLFFDTSNTQKVLEERLVTSSNDEMKDDFFVSYHSKFQKILALCYTTGKNFFMYRRFSKYINMKSKLMMQFLQLLGEGFNKGFLKKILEPIYLTNSQSKLFNDEELMYDKERYNYDLYSKYKAMEEKAYKNVEDVKKTERSSKNHASLKSETDVNSVIYKDENMIEGNNSNGLQKIEFYKFLFKQMIFATDYITLNKSIPFELPNDNLIILISNIIAFLIEFNGNCDENYHIELSKNFKDLYEKIKTMIFNRGVGFCEVRQQILLHVKVCYLRLLTSLINNGKFKDHINELIREIGLTSLYEEIIYYMNDLIQNYKESGDLPQDVSLKDEIIVTKLINLYIYNMDFGESLQLKFCITAFKYIKIIGLIYNINGVDKYYKENSDVLEASYGKENTNENSFYSLSGLTVYKFFNEIIKKVDVRSAEEDGTKPILYINPPLTYLLSEQTKQNFLNNVDRSSPFSKLGSLISQTDYFLYEMFYYYNRAMQGKVNFALKNFKLKSLETLNYLFIVIHQILLFYYFYFSNDSPPATSDERYVIYSGNFVLSIIQIIYIGLVGIVWSMMFLKLAFQESIMKKHNVKFLIKSDKDIKNSRNVVKFTDNFVEDNKDLLEHLNDKVSFYNKSKIFVIDLILFNRSLNVFIFTFVFLIVYLTSKNSFFLVIPTLFIANLSPLLSDIVYAVKIKWKQLSLVIMFTYLLVYLFSWVSFLYLYEIFDTDVLVIKTKQTATESMCSNAIECWTNMINYGVRSGGGIGDILPKVSFYQSGEYFASQFFFNVFFHIVIVLVLGNIFLGVIVDTFAELRDEKNKFDNDYINICFVCQLSRDKSINRFIDFDKHVENDHLVWNYVNFMIYLYVNNPMDFNEVELNAFKKLRDQDISWIPIESE